LATGSAIVVDLVDLIFSSSFLTATLAVRLSRGTLMRPSDRLRHSTPHRREHGFVKDAWQRLGQHLSLSITHERARHSHDGVDVFQNDLHLTTPCSLPKDALGTGSHQSWRSTLTQHNACAAAGLFHCQRGIALDRRPLSPSRRAARSEVLLRPRY
jgi:hypothetical protein